MALTSDYRRANCAGGYVPNFRGTMQYSEEVDKLDNPGMISALQGIRNLSVTQRDFSKPPSLKNGLDQMPKNLIRAESGFTRPRATHSPNTLDIWNVDRGRVLNSSKCTDIIGSDCRAPNYMSTSETKEAFHTNALERRQYDWLQEFHGNKNSGFIRAFNPNPLDGRHLDPIWLGGPPYLGRVGPSITHQDYLPPTNLKTGKEFTLPLNMIGKTVTGFNRFKELQPCYREVGWKGPCRDFQTSYQKDYYPKVSHCDTQGKQIVGKGFNIAGNMGDLNLFGGPGYYLTEAMESYVSPVLEGRARHGHLRGAVDNFNQKSGFATGTQLHNPFVDPCRPRMDDRSNGPEDPTRYNPWPRFFAGHESILNKNYRPHPVTGKVTEFNVYPVENGTIYKDYPAVI